MSTVPPPEVDHDAVVALQHLLDDPATPAGHARRAMIVLLTAKGLDALSIARELRCGARTVVMWQERFRTGGLAGLLDAPRSGRPPSVDAIAIVVRTLQPPPLGVDRWTSRRLATDLGISNVSVAGGWRAWGIRPTRDGRVALATEPALPAAFSAVIGLCLRPGTAVLALERGPTAQRPGPDRTDLLELPDVERDPADPEPAGVTAFLRGVAVRRAAPGPPRDVALLVTGFSGPLARSAAELGLEVFAATAPWWRMAQVACLSAGADEYGRATVLALSRALRRPRSTTSFTWLPRR